MVKFFGESPEDKNYSRFEQTIFATLTPYLQRGTSPLSRES